MRAALNFVARGEAPLGIVYRSDAVSEPAVRVVATFPAGTHAPIVYPAAVVAGHDSPAARALLDALACAGTTGDLPDLWLRCAAAIVPFRSFAHAP